MRSVKILRQHCLIKSGTYHAYGCVGLILAGVTTCIGGQASSAKVPKTAKTTGAGSILPTSIVNWGNPQVQTAGSINVKDLSWTPSPNGNVGTVLFNTMKIDLQGQNQPLKKLQVVPLHITATLRQKRNFVGYLTDVRGFISKSKGARILILADIAGTHTIIDFPYGEEVKSQDITRSLFSLGAGDDRGRHTENPRMPAYNATFVISVQRRSPQDSATISLDSLDIKPTFEQMICAD